MKRNENLDYRGKPRVQTLNKEPSETVQSDAHLADITTILSKFGQQGMEMLDETALVYADVSEFSDFHDVMLQVREADVAFLKLPSKVREIFGHDVAVWLDTAHDEDKRDALVAAGFLKLVEVDPPGGTPGATTPGSGPGEKAVELGAEKTGGSAAADESAGAP